MSRPFFLERWPYVTAILIIAVTTLVRLWFVYSNQLDLVQDEAQYWDWSRRLELSYYSKGPLIAYIISLGTHFFGDTQLGVRIGAVAGSFLAQVLLFAGVAGLFRRPVAAMWTLVVANTAPLVLASALLMTTDNPLLVCWLGAMFCLYRASTREKAGVWFVLLAVLLAVGILAKYMMLAFLGVAFLYLLGLRWHRLLPSGFTRNLVTAAAVGTVAGLLPILIWNAANDFVGFKHVAVLAAVFGKAGAESAAQPFFRFDRFPDYIGSQIGLLTPWWFVFMLVGGWRALVAAVRRPVVPEEVNVREALLLTVSFWPLWLFFLFWSFHAKIYPNWAAVSYASGLILAGMAFAHHFQRTKLRLKYLWPALGLVIFLVLHLQGYLPLPEKYNPTLRLKGWSDLTHKLEEVQNAEFPASDKVFFFSDSYSMTAALAFYAPDKPITYCADFGRRMSQYDLWPGPEDKKGWGAIMVRKDYEDWMPDPLKAMCSELKNIHYQSTHRGKPARKFTITVCKEFTGPWPETKRAGY